MATSRGVSSGSIWRNELPEQQLPERSRNQRFLPPGVTTLIVRNVPDNLTQEDLVRLWPPAGTYDYLLLPCHPQKCNAGYAFMNFVSHDVAARFNERWHGRFVPELPGKRNNVQDHLPHPSLKVAAAKLQGVFDNLNFLGPVKLEQMLTMGTQPLLLINSRPVDPLKFYLELREARLRQEAMLGPTGWPKAPPVQQAASTPGRGSSAQWEPQALQHPNAEGAPARQWEPPAMPLAPLQAWPREVPPPQRPRPPAALQAPRPEDLPLPMMRESL